MPQPPEHDPLEPRPVKPIKAHLHLLALAAVRPLDLAVAARLTVYGPGLCHRLLEDLCAWRWLRPDGAITPLGRRSLGEMVEGAQAEIVERRRRDSECG